MEPFPREKPRSTGSPVSASSLRSWVLGVTPSITTGSMRQPFPGRRLVVKLSGLTHCVICDTLKLCPINLYSLCVSHRLYLSSWERAEEATVDIMTKLAAAGDKRTAQLARKALRSTDPYSTSEAQQLSRRL